MLTIKQIFAKILCLFNFPLIFRSAVVHVEYNLRKTICLCEYSFCFVGLLWNIVWIFQIKPINKWINVKTSNISYSNYLIASLSNIGVGVRFSRELNPVTGVCKSGEIRPAVQSVGQSAYVIHNTDTHVGAIE